MIQKISGIFALCLLVGCIMFSCKKDNSKNENQGPGNDKLQRVVAWLNAQSEKSTDTAFKRNINLLKENLLADGITTEAFNAKETLYIIPISGSFKTINITERKTLKNLVLIENEEHQFRLGNIVELISKSGDCEKLPQGLISSAYNKQSVNFTGTLSILSIGNRFVYELEYSKNRLAATRYLSKSPGTLGAGQRVAQATKTEGCIAWYLVETTYYSDGSYNESWTYLYTTCGDECQSTRIIGSTQAFKLNCGGGGGGGSSNPNEPVFVVQIDSVENKLTKPCMDSAFNKVTSSQIKNLITNLYSRTFVGYGHVLNVTIKDAPHLTVGGREVFAYSTHTTNTWEISLNNSYLTDTTYNMSQEAWGQIIIHEVLHSFIYQYWNDVYTAGTDHLMIFKNFVEPSKDLLMSAFNMSSSDALRLALNGIRDNWAYSDFDDLCQQAYGVGLSDVDAAFYAYTKGTSGKKCN